MAFAALVMAALLMWPLRNRLGEVIVNRLGGASASSAPCGPAPAPCAPAAPPDTGNDRVDARLWREADLKASGLPWPIICIDRRHCIQVYNRPAEILTGHPWNAAHGVDVGLLLDDTDAAVLRRDLDRYLHDRHGGDAMRMVGDRRVLHVLRFDDDVMPVEAIITDFGNGHGGWQIALQALSLEPS